MCKHCQGFWRSSNGGTRMVQISTNRERIQLILDEPPEQEWSRMLLPVIQLLQRWRGTDSGSLGRPVMQFGWWFCPIQRLLGLQPSPAWRHSMSRGSSRALPDGHTVSRAQVRIRYLRSCFSQPVQISNNNAKLVILGQVLTVLLAYDQAASLLLLECRFQQVKCLSLHHYLLQGLDLQP